MGVFQSIRPKGLLDRPEEVYGQSLETLVAQHLRAWMSYSNEDTQLFFWRTKGGLEVDFVLYGEQHFCAIEVKHAQSIGPGDLRGLKAFKEDYPQAKCVLLYRGSQRLQKDDILCLPVEQFLTALQPGSLPF